MVISLFKMAPRGVLSFWLVFASVTHFSGVSCRAVGHGFGVHAAAVAAGGIFAHPTQTADHHGPVGGPRCDERLMGTYTPVSNRSKQLSPPLSLW